MYSFGHYLKDGDGEEIQFITDTTRDPALQQDLLPFQLDDESNDSEQPNNEIQEFLRYY